MTALEKLNALQAGELGKILDASNAWENTTEPVTLLAAKVEVTKVVLDEVIEHLNREFKAYGPSGHTNKALALLQQLKESL
jgi:hypothetical protein